LARYDSYGRVTLIMTAYAALLRAVNVGGTGKLAMSDLRALCEDCGLVNPATYIQSGNVVFESKRGEASVKKLLEQAVSKKLGKPADVLLRTRQELEALAKANPFPKAPPNRVIALFLDRPPPRGSLDDVLAPDGEQVAASGRHVVVHYPNGMGRSKLKLPNLGAATARNLNTVHKLIEMLAALEAK
jgi:uncharacterized protein (DUF1697 family)